MSNQLTQNNRCNWIIDLIDYMAVASEFKVTRLLLWAIDDDGNRVVFGKIGINMIEISFSITT